MPTERPDLTKVIAKFDSFNTVTERLAISVMKLAGWIATVAIVLYGLWGSLSSLALHVGVPRLPHPSPTPSLTEQPSPPHLMRT